MTFIDAQGNERDLDAEEAAFEQRRWQFRVHAPAVTAPPLPEDPTITPSFLAKSWKVGEASARFQADGDTADGARAKLLDLMFDDVPITDR